MRKTGYFTMSELRKIKSFAQYSRAETRELNLSSLKEYRLKDRGHRFGVEVGRLGFVVAKNCHLLTVRESSVVTVRN